jgi:hypothetical protein
VHQEFMGIASHRPPTAGSGEPQHEGEAVSIAADGVWTGAADLGQPMHPKPEWSDLTPSRVQASTSQHPVGVGDFSTTLKWL